MPELIFSSPFSHSGFSRFLIPSCYSIAVPLLSFAAALCFGQLVPVLFSLHLDYLWISSSFPSLFLVLVEAGGGLACMACVHIFLCSAPGTAMQAQTVHHRIMSQPAVRAQTDWWAEGGQLGTSYQLCCRGDEEMEQIKCRSTKAVFKACTVLIVQKQGSSQCMLFQVSAEQCNRDCPRGTAKICLLSTPFSAGLHGLTGRSLGSV